MRPTKPSASAQRRATYLARIWDVFVTKLKPPAVNKEGKPTYYSAKHPYGCAIGCLLSPEKRKALESNRLTVELLMSGRSDALAPLDKTDVNFLKRLQEAHDGGFGNSQEETERKRRKEKLLAIAQEYGVPVP